MSGIDASIVELADLYRDEEIDRAQYWRLMGEHHRRFRDYQLAIKDSRIEEITIERSGLVVQLDNGLKLGWNPEDTRQAASVIINHGDYEITEGRILEIVADQAEVFLDIGANCGWYALHLQKRMAENGKAYAFEPVLMTYEELQKNITRNDLHDKISAYNIALSDQPGIATMYLPDFSGSPAASLRNLHGEENNIEVKCEMDTLDAFVVSQKIKKIDFIKCDVEGAELMVLRGGAESIKRYRPVLFLEILRKWSREFGYHPNDILKFLADFGYVCWGIVGEDLILHDQVDEDTIATNYIFAMPDVHEGILGKLGLHQ